MSNIVPYINIHTHKRVENEISIECVGIHPYLAESCEELAQESITAQTEAIGEIGLDFSRPISQVEQERLFRAQLSVAERLRLPVVIHSVRAMARTMEILREFRLKEVILHGFIGSREQAATATARGYYLSFGHRTFASPKSLSALHHAPLSQIFFETDEADSPIQEIYRRGAEWREESLEEIKEQLYKNYTKIFKQQ